MVSVVGGVFGKRPRTECHTAFTVLCAANDLRDSEMIVIASRVIAATMQGTEPRRADVEALEAYFR